ncbi:MAG: radical SAM protein, partial [Candidatus Omnitrophica bacterium]|nr:radical SAM protein [Candidatus Omnitrophota bacterium]
MHELLLSGTGRDAIVIKTDPEQKPKNWLAWVSLRKKVEQAIFRIHVIQLQEAIGTGNLKGVRRVLHRISGSDVLSASIFERYLNAQAAHIGSLAEFNIFRSILPQALGILFSGYAVNQSVFDILGDGTSNIASSSAASSPATSLEEIDPIIISLLGEDNLIEAKKRYGGKNFNLRMETITSSMCDIGQGLQDFVKFVVPRLGGVENVRAAFNANVNRRFEECFERISHLLWFIPLIKTLDAISADDYFTAPVVYAAFRNDPYGFAHVLCDIAEMGVKVFRKRAGGVYGFDNLRFAFTNHSQGLSLITEMMRHDADFFFEFFIAALGPEGANREAFANDPDGYGLAAREVSKMGLVGYRGFVEFFEPHNCAQALSNDPDGLAAVLRLINDDEEFGWSDFRRLIVELTAVLGLCLAERQEFLSINTVRAGFSRNPQSFANFMKRIHEMSLEVFTDSCYARLKEYFGRELLEEIFRYNPEYIFRLYDCIISPHIVTSVIVETEKMMYSLDSLRQLSVGSQQLIRQIIYNRIQDLYEQGLLYYSDKEKPLMELRQHLLTSTIPGLRVVEHVYRNTLATGIEVHVPLKFIDADEKARLVTLCAYLLMIPCNTILREIEEDGSNLELRLHPGYFPVVIENIEYYIANDLLRPLNEQIVVLDEDGQLHDGESFAAYHATVQSMLGKDTVTLLALAYNLGFAIKNPADLACHKRSPQDQNYFPGSYNYQGVTYDIYTGKRLRSGQTNIFTQSRLGVYFRNSDDEDEIIFSAYYPADVSTLSLLALMYSARTNSVAGEPFASRLKTIAKSFDDSLSSLLRNYLNLSEGQIKTILAQDYIMPAFPPSPYIFDRGKVVAATQFLYSAINANNDGVSALNQLLAKSREQISQAVLNGGKLNLRLQLVIEGGRFDDIIPQLQQVQLDEQLRPDAEVLLAISTASSAVSLSKPLLPFKGNSWQAPEQNGQHVSSPVSNERLLLNKNKRGGVVNSSQTRDKKSVDFFVQQASPNKKLGLIRRINEEICRIGGLQYLTPLRRYALFKLLTYRDVLSRAPPLLSVLSEAIKNRLINLIRQQPDKRDGEYCFSRVAQAVFGGMVEDGSFSDFCEYVQNKNYQALPGSANVLLVDSPFSADEAVVGLYRIASFLSLFGINVHVIDKPQVEGFKPSLSFYPHIVGKRFLTATFQEDVDIISLLEKQYPDSIFIAGGHEASISGRVFEVVPCLDAAVMGWGEFTLLDIVMNINCHGRQVTQGKKEAALGGIQGIRIGKREISRSNPFNSMDFRVITQAYNPRLLLSRVSPVEVINVHGASHCMQKCTFCMANAFFVGSVLCKQPVLNIEPDDFIILARRIREYLPDVRWINFTDDNFLASRSKTEKWLDAIEREGLHKHFGFFIDTRLDSLDNTGAGTLERMARLGVVRIYVGIESPHENILRDLQKGKGAYQRITRYRDILRKAKESGIPIVAVFMILQTPHETINELLVTIENIIGLISEYDIASAISNGLSIFPGTPLWSMYERGQIKVNYQTIQARDPRGQDITIPYRVLPTDGESLRLFEYINSGAFNLSHRFHQDTQVYGKMFDEVRKRAPNALVRINLEAALLSFYRLHFTLFAIAELFLPRRHEILRRLDEMIVKRDRWFAQQLRSSSSASSATLNLTLPVLISPGKTGSSPVVNLSLQRARAIGGKVYFKIGNPEAICKLMKRGVPSNLPYFYEIEKFLVKQSRKTLSILRRAARHKENMPKDTNAGKILNALLKEAGGRKTTGRKAVLSVKPAPAVDYRPLVAGVRKHKKTSSPASKTTDLYQHLLALSDDKRAQEHEATLEALRAYPDKELLQVRLKAAVAKVTQKRSLSNWERMGAYVKADKPDFIARYADVAQGLFLGRMLADYLKYLNRDVKIGDPEALEIKDKLVKLARAMVAAAEDEDAISALLRNIERLGSVKEGTTFKKSATNGPPSLLCTGLDRGYGLLAQRIAEAQPQILPRMRQRIGSLFEGYCIEEAFTLLNSDAGGSNRSTMMRDKKYLRDVIIRLARPRHKLSFWYPEISREVLLSKLDAPTNKSLTEIIMDIQHCDEDSAKHLMYSGFMGREISFIIGKNARLLRRVLRVLDAEPDFSDSARYVKLFIDKQVLKKGAVVVGHFYYSYENGERVVRLATAQDRKTFALSMPTRLAQDEIFPDKLDRAVGNCFQYHQAHSRLPSLAQWRRLAGFKEPQFLITHRLRIVKELEKRGLSLLGNTWFDMAETSVISQARLQAIKALMPGPMDEYVASRRNNVGLAGQPTAGWQNYRKELEAKPRLGKPVLLLTTRSNPKTKTIEIHAFYEDGSDMKTQIVNTIKMDEQGRIEGVNQKIITIRSLLGQQSDTRIMKVSAKGGFYYGRKSNYLGLADIAGELSVDLSAVKITLHLAKGEIDPYFTIEMPGNPQEELPLNSQYLPLCKGEEGGRHTYSLPVLLREQTHLAQKGDPRFKASPFTLGHPDFSRRIRVHSMAGSYDSESGRMALCERARLPYSAENLLKALDHPSNQYTTLKNSGKWTLWKWARDEGLIKPNQSKSPSGNGKAKRDKAGRPKQKVRRQVRTERLKDLDVRIPEATPPHALLDSRSNQLHRPSVTMPVLPRSPPQEELPNPQPRKENGPSKEKEPLFSGIKGFNRLARQPTQAVILRIATFLKAQHHASICEFAPAYQFTIILKSGRSKNLSVSADMLVNLPGHNGQGRRFVVVREASPMALFEEFLLGENTPARKFMRILSRVGLINGDRYSGVILVSANGIQDMAAGQILPLDQYISQQGIQAWENRDSYLGHLCDRLKIMLREEIASGYFEMLSIDNGQALSIPAEIKGRGELGASSPATCDLPTNNYALQTPSFPAASPLSPARFNQTDITNYDGIYNDISAEDLERYLGKGHRVFSMFKKGLPGASAERHEKAEVWYLRHRLGIQQPQRLKISRAQYEEADTFALAHQFYWLHAQLSAKGTEISVETLMVAFFMYPDCYNYPYDVWENILTNFFKSLYSGTVTNLPPLNEVDAAVEFYWREADRDYVRTQSRHIPNDLINRDFYASSVRRVVIALDRGRGLLSQTKPTKKELNRISFFRRLGRRIRDEAATAGSPAAQDSYFPASNLQPVLEGAVYELKGAAIALKGWPMNYTSAHQAGFPHRLRQSVLTALRRILANLQQANKTAAISEKQRLLGLALGRLENFLGEKGPIRKAINFEVSHGLVPSGNNHSVVRSSAQRISRIFYSLNALHNTHASGEFRVETVPQAPALSWILYTEQKPPKPYAGPQPASSPASRQPDQAHRTPGEFALKPLVVGVLDEITGDPRSLKVNAGDIAEMLIARGHTVTKRQVNQIIVDSGLRKRYPDTLVYERLDKKALIFSRSDILWADPDNISEILSAVTGNGRILDSAEDMLLCLDVTSNVAQASNGALLNEREKAKTIAPWLPIFYAVKQMRQMRKAIWTKLAPLLKRPALEEIGHALGMLTAREAEMISWCLDERVRWSDCIKARKLFRIKRQAGETARVRAKDVEKFFWRARGKLKHLLPENVIAAFFPQGVRFPQAQSQSGAKDVLLSPHQRILEAVFVDGAETMREVAIACGMPSKRVQGFLTRSLSELRGYLRIQRKSRRSKDSFSRQRRIIRNFVIVERVNGPVSMDRIIKRVYGNTHTPSEYQRAWEDVCALQRSGAIRPADVTTQTRQFREKQAIVAQQAKIREIVRRAQDFHITPAVPYITGEIYGKDYTSAQRKTVEVDVKALFEAGLFYPGLIVSQHMVVAERKRRIVRFVRSLQGDNKTSVPVIAAHVHGIGYSRAEYLRINRDVEELIASGAIAASAINRRGSGGGKHVKLNPVRSSSSVGLDIKGLRAPGTDKDSSYAVSSPAHRKNKQKSPQKNKHQLKLPNPFSFAAIMGAGLIGATFWVGNNVDDYDFGSKIMVVLYISGVIATLFYFAAHSLLFVPPPAQDEAQETAQHKPAKNPHSRNYERRKEKLQKKPATGAGKTFVDLIREIALRFAARMYARQEARNRLQQDKERQATRLARQKVALEQKVKQDKQQREESLRLGEFEKRMAELMDFTELTYAAAFEARLAGIIAGLPQHLLDKPEIGQSLRKARQAWAKELEKRKRQKLAALSARRMLEAARADAMHCDIYLAYTRGIFASISADITVSQDTGDIDKADNLSFASFVCSQTMRKKIDSKAAEFTRVVNAAQEAQRQAQISESPEIIEEARKINLWAQELAEEARRLKAFAEELFKSSRATREQIKCKVQLKDEFSAAIHRAGYNLEDTIDILLRSFDELLQARKILEGILNIPLSEGLNAAPSIESHLKRVAAGVASARQTLSAAILEGSNAQFSAQKLAYPAYVVTADLILSASGFTQLNISVLDRQRGEVYIEFVRIEKLLLERQQEEEFYRKAEIAIRNVDRFVGAVPVKILKEIFEAIRSGKFAQAQESWRKLEGMILNWSLTNKGLAAMDEVMALLEGKGIINPQGFYLGVPEASSALSQLHYPMQEGLPRLFALVRKALDKEGATAVLRIRGDSYAGKTTFVRSIVRAGEISFFEEESFYDLPGEPGFSYRAYSDSLREAVSIPWFRLIVLSGFKCEDIAGVPFHITVKIVADDATRKENFAVSRPQRSLIRDGSLSLQTLKDEGYRYDLILNNSKGYRLPSGAKIDLIKGVLEMPAVSSSVDFRELGRRFIDGCGHIRHNNLAVLSQCREVVSEAARLLSDSSQQTGVRYLSMFILTEQYFSDGLSPFDALRPRLDDLPTYHQAYRQALSNQLFRAFVDGLDNVCSVYQDFKRNSGFGRQFVGSKPDDALAQALKAAQDISVVLSTSRELEQTSFVKEFLSGVPGLKGFPQYIALARTNTEVYLNHLKVFMQSVAAFEGEANSSPAPSDGTSRVAIAPGSSPLRGASSPSAQDWHEQKRRMIFEAVRQPFPSGAVHEFEPYHRHHLSLISDRLKRELHIRDKGLFDLERIYEWERCCHVELGDSLSISALLSSRTPNVIEAYTQTRLLAPDNHDLIGYGGYCFRGPPSGVKAAELTFHIFGRFYEHPGYRGRRPKGRAESYVAIFFKGKLRYLYHHYGVRIFTLTNGQIGGSKYEEINKGALNSRAIVTYVNAFGFSLVNPSADAEFKDALTRRQEISKAFIKHIIEINPEGLYLDFSQMSSSPSVKDAARIKRFFKGIGAQVAAIIGFEVNPENLALLIPKHNLKEWAQIFWVMRQNPATLVCELPQIVDEMNKIRRVKLTKKDVLIHLRWLSSTEEGFLLRASWGSVRQYLLNEDRLKRILKTRVRNKDDFETIVLNDESLHASAVRLAENVIVHDPIAKAARSGL